jgi:hypothetical protein
MRPCFGSGLPRQTVVQKKSQRVTVGLIRVAPPVGIVGANRLSQVVTSGLTAAVWALALSVSERRIGRLASWGAR